MCELSRPKTEILSGKPRHSKDHFMKLVMTDYSVDIKGIIKITDMRSMKKFT